VDPEDGEAKGMSKVLGTNPADVGVYVSAVHKPTGFHKFHFIIPPQDFTRTRGWQSNVFVI
jgi:hypothetical protein